MILSAYIDMNEYRHSLVVKCDDGWTHYVKLYSTGKTPPPIDPTTLKGRQQLWVLGKIAGQDVGEFPRD